MRARRAFIFTADAVLALYLITIILSILMLLSYSPRLYTEQSQAVARDVIVALSRIRLRDVQGNPQYGYTNSLLNIRKNSIAIWPMFGRTIDRSSSLYSVYPSSNSTWIVYNVAPQGVITSVHSTPILDYGKIIIASQNGTKAFNENTGTQLWYMPIRVDSTPLLYNGEIYFGSPSGTFYCVDELGHVVWNATLFSNVTSPVADNGRVFVGAMNGSVVSFDILSNATVVLPFIATSNITAPPLIYNKIIIIFSHDGTLSAIDEESGTSLWSYTQPPPQPIDLPVDPSPAVYNGVVYFTNEFLVNAVNLTTGIPPVGSWPVQPSNIKFTSSLAMDNGMLYIGCNNSLTGLRGVCAINTTDQSINQVNAGSNVYAAPLVVNDSVILATYDGTVTAVSKSALRVLGTLQTLWSYKISNPINPALPLPVISSPSAVNGRIYIGADDGNVYSFGNCSLWDDNMSVMDSIVAFWSINRTDCARAMAKEFLDSAVPQNYGFELVVRPPEGSGLPCTGGLGPVGLNACSYCNGTLSNEWDSIYTNDCNQSIYQRFLIKDSRYISGILQMGSTIYYARSPVEVELRIWN
ncbi:PQQ-binding-like beta-propeller repeat protein [Candidatus Micrarchaeota archaeon]|nr:PQQ-binding-like beta-propeller repeat protein [Candidatus Micrarchaeota archaeon]